MWDQSQSVSNKRRVKPGILRLDISKPRRSSGGSVEFKVQPELLGDVVPSASPGSTGATSPPQLSVTWASVCDGEELDPKIDSNKTRMSQMHSQLKASLDIVKKYQSFEETINEGNSGINTPNEEGHISEEDDYSASVSAIMQRRASIRGNRKKSFRSSTRNSSPMDALTSAAADRRRSSVFTTSSGDTAASVEEGPQDSTQEQIIENIRLHKEVLQSVKYQPWSMRRKLRLVRQAKAYVAKHQGVLQERFAMSRSTKDLWARFKIMMTAVS
ncbi:unnamed protein product [Hermetia illucens]|uniref:Uncharacterized protein n=1 Tax=Hermetia illucens TaxID=343691 RepID=A0A7R8UJV6_HERIL|nr:unnamed protein product [Hermetia illucens]